MILQRDEEIRKIVETICELAQIMGDLAQLITEQGTMVDRIEHNIQVRADGTLSPLLSLPPFLQLHCGLWFACSC